MARVFHRLRPALVPLSAIVCCLLALQASGSSADVTYRSTVSEVRLTFFATDETNHGVETLQNNDFAVVDDGLVIRQFRSFARSNVTHLEIVVLVDVSQSVVSRFRQEIGDVLQLISSTQSIPEDHISVISFGGMRQTVICSGNCRDSSVSSRLLEAKADGATPLFDALQFAGNFVAQRRAADARPVVILFSDGEDTISRVSSIDALHAVLESEVTDLRCRLERSRAASPTAQQLSTSLPKRPGAAIFPSIRARQRFWALCLRISTRGTWSLTSCPTARRDSIPSAFCPRATRNLNSVAVAATSIPR